MRFSGKRSGHPRKSTFYSGLSQITTTESADPRLFPGSRLLSGEGDLGGALQARPIRLAPPAWTAEQFPNQYSFRTNGRTLAPHTVRIRSKLSCRSLRFLAPLR